MPKSTRGWVGPFCAAYSSRFRSGKMGARVVQSSACTWYSLSTCHLAARLFFVLGLSSHGHC